MFPTPVPSCTSQSLTHCSIPSPNCSGWNQAIRGSMHQAAALSRNFSTKMLEKKNTKIFTMTLVPLLHRWTARFDRQNDSCACVTIAPPGTGCAENMPNRDEWMNDTAKIIALGNQSSVTRPRDWMSKFQKRLCPVSQPSPDYYYASVRVPPPTRGTVGTWEEIRWSFVGTKCPKARRGRFSTILRLCLPVLF